ncbi:MAG TPA: hypothetical protein VHZ95_03495, partial [Polyangiales bacterium]|nr:hypothetical protein [Polyangiales bacterium]
MALALAISGTARADDWLAVLPACEERTEMEPTFALVYPSESLPAIVAAGDALIARMRVPAALTPPPGVQQERALSGWSAELVGDGIPLEAAIAHRHNVPVVEIRPDTGASLIYRVRLAVPAYAAPGSYALVVRTPFGDRRIEHAVSVIAPNRLPLMAAMPPHDAIDRALASSEFDVFVDREPIDPSFPRPHLVVGAHTLALRVGRELWTSAPCPNARDRFEAEVLDVLRTEQRTRVNIDRRLPPSAASEAIALVLEPHGL